MSDAEPAFDPRLTLRRQGRAAAELEGLIDADAFVEPRPWRVCTPALAVRKAPAAAAEQIDQLLFGESFDALEAQEGAGEAEGGFVFGQARRDGYVGWVEATGLVAAGLAPTHRVRALRAYAFAAPEVRATASGPFSMNALLTVDAADGAFVHAIGAGWIAAAHVTPLGADFACDWAQVAEGFLGTPYLWGGRDSLGLDCSGLVQAALYACGRACARDSDLQRALGRRLEHEPLARGDLVFWRGHVGLMLDPVRLLHANAHHMAVAIEPLSQARDRIAERGGGEVLECRRLD